ncbi:MAG: polyketide synthase dehydratase domain-containing protein, partial [Acidobacteria bacterium]|nr:polyketide synthase dehydratase domain-containing protein [Acidobacteriota bacterium]
GEQETVHCQGRVLLSERPAASALDLDDLRAAMRHSQRDADSVYAELAMLGLHYGPSQRTITAVQHGDEQLLARLTLPAVCAGNGAFVLHPSVMTGAVQAGVRLIAGSTRGRGAAVLPRKLRLLRVLSPCTEEMFAWARHAKNDAMEDGVELDIDVIDADGQICVQMRGLGFAATTAKSEPKGGVQWLFGAQEATDDQVAVSMRTAEKIELFLRQELALQLQKPIDEIPVDQNYFDLGLTSLVIAHLIQKTSRLLGEDLSPSTLLEYSDLRGVASYLAATYAASIDALPVAKRSITSAPAAGPQETLSRLPRKQFLPIRMTSAPASREQILAEIRWQDAMPEDAYDTMTF